MAVFGLAVSMVTAYFLFRQIRRQDKDSARDEAIDLAEVRGKVIDDLEGRLDGLERKLDDERREHEKKVETLEQVIEHVRSESAETLRLLMVGMRGVMIKLLDHLESDPAEVDKAIDYLRESLNVDAPPLPAQPRRRRRTA